MNRSDGLKEHRTASRVTGILEEVAKHQEGLRLNDLAEALAAPRSSMHGLVKGLVATGYLRETQGAYTLGPAVPALLSLARPTVERAARPSLEALQRFSGETVMLAFLVGNAVVYMDAVESSQMIRYSAPLRTRRPLYPTSSGKCFLAFASAQFRETYLAEHIPTDQVSVVQDELQNIVDQGVSMNRGQTLPDVSGISAPLFDGSTVAAVLSLAGPTARMTSRMPELADEVKQQARLAADRLQGSA